MTMWVIGGVVVVAIVVLIVGVSCERELRRYEQMRGPH